MMNSGHGTAWVLLGLTSDCIRRGMVAAVTAGFSGQKK